MPYTGSQTLVTASHLSVWLRTARKQRGLTQAQVAGRLGLSQNRVSHLELHADELSVKQLLGWCAAVGLELHLADRAAAENQPTAEW